MWKFQNDVENDFGKRCCCTRAHAGKHICAAKGVRRKIIYWSPDELARKTTPLSLTDLFLISSHISIYGNPCCRLCCTLCPKWEDKIRPRQHRDRPALHSSCVVMTQTVSSRKHTYLCLTNYNIGLPSPLLTSPRHPPPISSVHTNTQQHNTALHSTGGVAQSSSEIIFS